MPVQITMSPLRFLRFKAGLSQEKLAELSGVAQWKISDFELEKRQPTENESKALRKVLEKENGNVAA